MTLHRVALIYDDTIRPETTGVYCLRALRHMAGVEHVLPKDLANISRDNYDLYLNIDDGLAYPLPDDLYPRAWWAIDTHLEFERSLVKALGADFVFAAQQDGAARLRSEGIDSAVWLPLACDSSRHRRHDVAKQFDVSFVGNFVSEEREQLVRLIEQHYSNSFVGNRYFEEMARTYSASRIVFNKSVAGDVNMRVFEALCSGSLLLTNDLNDNGQAEMFEEGVHLVTYQDADDLLEKIAYYLEHEDERERIAAAGRREVLARHTYLHRMHTLLRTVERHLEAEPKQTAGSAERPGRLLKRSRDDRTDRGRQDNSDVDVLALPTTPAANAKTKSYFEFARPELLAMIPTSARRILDVGCGAGILGASVKERQGAEAWGIERDPQIADLARRRLDRVLSGDAQQIDAEIEPASFDCIVCGDVLEHMRSPEEFLKKTRAWLTPGGRLIASIPNVRHHSVVTALLAGNWTYESAGLLDEDHVRFFTRREIEKLFYRSGFEVRTMNVVPGPGHREWEEKGQPGEVDVGGMRIGGMTAGEAEEFFAYQYLVEAVTSAAVESDGPGLTSIVIVTHNQLAYTHQCVESIQQRTDEPYELIFVDNGSTDGTPEFLRSIPGAKLIVNSDNRGFPAAVNQGIQAASGRQILLLNNDTLATTGWLRRMLDTLSADETIGLVGPCSNNVSGPQQVPIAYSDLSSLDGFAWDRGKQFDRQTTDVDRLVGFCLLIRREVIDKIGLLDERFGIGNFEDDDYCRRALAAGYRAVIAEDAFIHHFGSATFRASGVDFAGLLEENERLYQEKWKEEPVSKEEKPAGNTESLLEVTQPTDTSPKQQPLFSISIAANNAGLLLEKSESENRGTNPAGRSRQALPNSELRTPNSKLRVSLCMIVRDNAAIIEDCLTSIKPWVDEMVVVDTGSTDETAAIAERLGARVFHFPWCDDFAAARNESLKHARGEWIFWMDSDDTIDADNGRQLRELADGKHEANILGYVMQVHCPGSDEAGHTDVTAVDHVKLIRNRPDLRFECRIHEQILPAIRRVGGQVAFTDIFVVHSGSDHTPEGKERKYERDFRLLHLELDEKPDHPFALFNLGMTYADADRHQEAIQYLRRCLDVSQPVESHVRKAYALLVSSYAQAGRHDEAWDVCCKGRGHFPHDAELLFRAGMLDHHFGRLEDAVAAYQAAVTNRDERHFSSADRGITGYKARHNLALVYEEMDRPGDAEIQWRKVVAEVPGYRPGWRGLGRNLITQKKFHEARATADRLLDATSDDQATLRAEGLMIQARIAQSEEKIDAARRLLEQARREFPDDLDPLRELCELLFWHAAPEEAVAALEELSKQDPEDGSTPHNLGTLYLKAGQPSKAVSAYRESLRRRPDSAATYLQLGQALHSGGQIDEAVSAWEQTLRLDPHNTAAQAALNDLMQAT